MLTECRTRRRRCCCCFFVVVTIRLPKILCSSSTLRLDWCCSLFHSCSHTSHSQLVTIAVIFVYTQTFFHSHTRKTVWKFVVQPNMHVFIQRDNFALAFVYIFNDGLQQRHAATVFATKSTNGMLSLSNLEWFMFYHFLFVFDEGVKHLFTHTKQLFPHFSSNYLLCSRAAVSKGSSIQLIR